MKKYFPFLDWISTYNSSAFKGDLGAGLTVGVMLIPQGMAYSMLAGLPPIYGLYASTIPLIIYALFGTSRQLAVGPVAMVALLISSGVGALAEIGSEEFIGLAILLALMVGMIQFSMGVFRLGFLVNFLSHPVIAGFTSAAAIIIGFSQLKHLLGINIPRGKVHETILNIVEHIGQVNIPTLIIGIVAILTLVGIKQLKRRIPGPLIVVLFGILVVYFAGLYDQGVAIVKDIPGGLPSFSFPGIELSSIQALLPIAFTIAFVGFMESIAVAKAIQRKHNNYEIVPNQELIGLGLANIIGSFFKIFPVTGGFSRTAVNDQAGAKSGMASIISALLIVVTLLFLTEYFYYLPNAILAAIILVAVFGLIDIAEAKHLWKTDKNDFWLFMITAVGTLVLGIEEGILIGVALSLLVIIYKTSYPHIAELGKIPGKDIYRNIKRFEQVKTYPDILIIRIDAQLYFANAGYVKDYLYEKLRERPAVKHIVINASTISTIDSSALQMLHNLITEMRSRGISLYFIGVRGPVRDIFKKAKMMDELGQKYFFLNIQDAVDMIQIQTDNDYTDYSTQAFSD